MTTRLQPKAARKELWEGNNYICIELWELLKGIWQMTVILSTPSPLEVSQR